ncbi:MAG: hypothetical protein HC831_00105 [Chloroflexia bacterium]|nr:hypothetical protein [Chloroflexia bacterium]
MDYIDIEAIDNSKFIIEKPKRHTWETAPSRAQQIVQTGDTLFSTVRPYLKNIALVTPKHDKSIASSGFCVIRPLVLNPIYVHNFVLTQHFIESVNSLAKGTSYPAVTSKIIQEQLLPIPPLQEQTRIVSKIEELFSELSHAIMVLNKTQQHLKSYKQTLLNYAFSGSLTKEWRFETESTSAYEHLTKIQEDRKLKYLRDLSQYQSKKIKKKPKKDFDFKYKEHKSIKNWATVDLDKSIYIAARIGWRGLKKSDYTQEGAILLSVHSLNHGKVVDFSYVNYISDDRYEESPEIQLELNDILLCKDGAGIGKIGIVKTLPEKSTVNSSILVVRGKEVFDPNFLFYLLSGPTMQKLVNEKFKEVQSLTSFKKTLRNSH